MLTVPACTGSSARVVRESVSCRRMGTWSDPLNQHRETLPDPHAQRRETAVRVLALHPAEQRDGQPGAAAAERVAGSDCATVGVDPLDIEAEPVDAGEHLRRERLVDLHRINLAGRPAGAVECLL